VRARLQRPAPHPWSRPVWATAAALAAAIVLAIVVPQWPRQGAEVAQAPTVTHTGADEKLGMARDTRTTPEHDAVAGAGLQPVPPPKPATGVKPITIAKDPFAGTGGRERGAGKPPVAEKLDRFAAPVKVNDGAVTPTPNAMDRAHPPAENQTMAPTRDDMPVAADSNSKSIADDVMLRGMKSAGGVAMAEASAQDPQSKSASSPPPAAVRLDAASNAQPASPALGASIVGERLHLRVSANEAGSLQVTAGKSEQLYGVKPPETVVMLEARTASSLSLTLRTGAATSAYYYIAPGRAQAKFGSATFRALPALEALQRWALGSGYAVLCPQELVNGQATLAVGPNPLEALQAYATERNARATLERGVATLTPKR
jgi:hypothetical protein